MKHLLAINERITNNDPAYWILLVCISLFFLSLVTGCTHEQEFKDSLLETRDDCFYQALPQLDQVEFECLALRYNDFGNLEVLFGTDKFDYSTNYDWIFETAYGNCLGYPKNSNRTGVWISVNQLPGKMQRKRQGVVPFVTPVQKINIYMCLTDNSEIE